MSEAHVREFGKWSILEPPFEWGNNIFVGHFVHIRPNVEIGDNTEIRDHCYLAEGCKIGANTRIMQKCNIASGAVIGDWCFLSVGVILTNDRTIQYPKINGQWKKEPPTIGNYVKIGAGAIILAGVKIDDNAIIGAGSIVTHDVPKGTIWMGNPAREKT